MPKKFGDMMRALFLALFFSCFAGTAIAGGEGADGGGLYAHPTSEGLPNGAILGDILSGAGNDRLVSASSPVCDHIELHQMQEADGIMRMRAVPFIPAGEGQKINLSPMGYHLMLMKLKNPLQEGQVFPVTLVFEKSGKKTTDVSVVPRPR